MSKLLEKIKKLYEKSESAKELGNEEEAMAFMDKVQELLFNNKLQVSDLQFEAKEKPIEVDHTHFSWANTTIGNKRKRVQWTGMLVSTICKFNGCSSLGMKGSNNHMFIGTPESIRVVEYLIGFLADFAEKKAQGLYMREHYKATKLDGGNKSGVHTHRVQLKGFKESFLLAFVNRIFERLQEKENELRENTDMSLVVFDKEAAAIDDHIEENFNVSNCKSVTRTAKNIKGVYAGRSAANEVSFNKGAIN